MSDTTEKPKKSFTSQEPQIVTEGILKAHWCGYPPGVYFRCKLCGYKFKLGDYWRWIYGGRSQIVNFIVCKSCDIGDDHELCEKMKEREKKFEELYWDKALEIKSLCNRPRRISHFER